MWFHNKINSSSNTLQSDLERNSNQKMSGSFFPDNTSTCLLLKMFCLWFSTNHRRYKRIILRIFRFPDFVEISPDLGNFPDILSLQFSPRPQHSYRHVRWNYPNHPCVTRVNKTLQRPTNKPKTIQLNPTNKNRKIETEEPFDQRSSIPVGGVSNRKT